MLATWGASKSLAARVRDIFAKYGTNAHMYLAGTEITQGFTPGNYVESTGVTPATVDQPVGLVLDAAGSVGAELFSDANVTFTGESSRVSSGVYRIYSSAGTLSFATIAGVTANKSYRVEFNIDSITTLGAGVQVDSVTTAFTSIGRKSLLITPAATSFVIKRATGATDIQISGVSVREITGIHASQSTSGFRPVERRGIVNLLLNNKWDGGGTAPTGWTAFGAGGAQGSVLPNGCYTRTFAPVASRDFINSNFTTAANTTYTIVLYVESNSGLLANELIGSGAIPAGATFAISGTTAPTGSYLFATLTVGATGGTFTLRCGAGCSGTETGSVTLSQPAIFAGTLTASQILAYGGIPMTTSAAASSSAGPYYLEHKAANSHHLKLASVPFQMADDFVVVFAGTVDSFAALRGLCGAYSSSTNNPRIQIYAALTSGSLLAQLRDDAGNTAIPTSLGPIVLGVPFVATLVKRGGLAFTRFNAVQSASASTAGLGVTTLDTFSIGETKGSYHSGNTNVCLPLKGTFTDAEITLLENQAAAIAGGRLVGGNFVSNI